jgi:hypothetical protein
MPESTVSVIHPERYRQGTHGDKKGAAEQPVPGVIWVVGVPAIEKDGPLVSRHHQLPTAELFLDP